MGIAILQFFPKFSTISPGVAILPLLIVIGVTLLKDGYEDIKRHQSDKRVNHSTVRVLSGDEWTNPNAMRPKSKTFVKGLIPKGRKSPGVTSSATSSVDGKDLKASGDNTINVIPLPHDPDIEFDYEQGVEPESKRTTSHWKKTLWEDVRVGDFVKLMDNESFPADILICATSEEENVAYVETKNLDGETNLKSRNAVPGLTHLRNAAACAKAQNAFQVRCDRPDNNMYRLNANILMDGDTSPVDLSMTLLRGTVLRNTEWVIGVVLYTGFDTKIVLNSGDTPSKRSKVERQMNPQV